MECRECKGKGTVVVPSECGKAASMCCGGCVKDEFCFVCDGLGELCEACMDEDTLEWVEIYDSLKAHKFEHKKIINDIYNHVNDVELNKALL
jgi:RecJ-like exonuclease